MSDSHTSKIQSNDSAKAASSESLSEALLGVQDPLLTPDALGQGGRSSGLLTPLGLRSISILDPSFFQRKPLIEESSPDDIDQSSRQNFSQSSFQPTLQRSIESSPQNIENISQNSKTLTSSPIQQPETSIKRSINDSILVSHESSIDLQQQNVTSISDSISTSTELNQSVSQPKSIQRSPESTSQNQPIHNPSAEVPIQRSIDNSISVSHESSIDLHQQNVSSISDSVSNSSELNQSLTFSESQLESIQRSPEPTSQNQPIQKSSTGSLIQRSINDSIPVSHESSIDLQQQNVESISNSISNSTELNQSVSQPKSIQRSPEPISQNQPIQNSSTELPIQRSINDSIPVSNESSIDLHQQNIASLSDSISNPTELNQSLTFSESQPESIQRSPEPTSQNQSIHNSSAEVSIQRSIDNSILSSNESSIDLQQQNVKLISDSISTPSELHQSLTFSESQPESIQRSPESSSQNQPIHNSLAEVSIQRSINDSIPPSNESSIDLQQKNIESISDSISNLTELNQSLTFSESQPESIQRLPEPTSQNQLIQNSSTELLIQRSIDNSISVSHESSIDLQQQNLTAISHSLSNPTELNQSLTFSESQPESIQRSPEPTSQNQPIHNSSAEVSIQRSINDSIPGSNESSIDLQQQNVKLISDSISTPSELHQSLTFSESQSESIQRSPESPSQNQPIQNSSTELPIQRSLSNSTPASNESSIDLHQQNVESISDSIPNPTELNQSLSQPESIQRSPESTSQNQQIQNSSTELPIQRSINNSIPESIQRSPEPTSQNQSIQNSSAELPIQRSLSNSIPASNESSIDLQQHTASISDSTATPSELNQLLTFSESQPEPESIQRSPEPTSQNQSIQHSSTEVSIQRSINDSIPASNESSIGIQQQNIASLSDLISNPTELNQSLTFSESQSKSIQRSPEPISQNQPIQNSSTELPIQRSLSNSTPASNESSIDLHQQNVESISDSISNPTELNQSLTFSESQPESIQRSPEPTSQNQSIQNSSAEVSIQRSIDDSIPASNKSSIDLQQQNIESISDSISNPSELNQSLTFSEYQPESIQRSPEPTSQNELIQNSSTELPIQRSLSNSILASNESSIDLQQQNVASISNSISNPTELNQSLTFSEYQPESIQRSPEPTSQNQSIQHSSAEVSIQRSISNSIPASHESSIDLQQQNVESIPDSIATPSKLNQSINFSESQPESESIQRSPEPISQNQPIQNSSPEVPIQRSINDSIPASNGSSIDLQQHTASISDSNATPSELNQSLTFSESQPEPESIQRSPETSPQNQPLKSSSTEDSIQESLRPSTQLNIRSALSESVDPIQRSITAATPTNPVSTPIEHQVLTSNHSNQEELSSIPELPSVLQNLSVLKPLTQTSIQRSSLLAQPSDLDTPFIQSSSQSSQNTQATTTESNVTSSFTRNTPQQSPQQWSTLEELIQAKPESRTAVTAAAPPPSISQPSTQSKSKTTHQSAYPKLTIQKKSIASPSSTPVSHPTSNSPIISSNFHGTTDSDWTVIAPSFDQTFRQPVSSDPRSHYPSIDRDAILQSDSFEALAQQIYHHLKRKLVIEQERLNGGSSGRLPW